MTLRRLYTRPSMVRDLNGFPMSSELLLQKRTLSASAIMRRIPGSGPRRTRPHALSRTTVNYVYGVAGIDTSFIPKKNPVRPSILCVRVAEPTLSNGLWFDCRTMDLTTERNAESFYKFMMKQLSKSERIKSMNTRPQSRTPWLTLTSTHDYLASSLRQTLSPGGQSD